MSNRVLHPNNKYDYMVKLSVVGDSPVGKTWLVQRFMYDMCSKSYKPTIVADQHNHMLKEDGKTIKVVIWDVGKGFGTAKTFISVAQGIIIVFDITNMESYRNVKEWLDFIALYDTENVYKILVGNKCDLSANRAVPTKTAKAFAKKLRIPYIETSAKDATNVEEAFMSMIRAIKKRTMQSNQSMVSVSNPLLRTFIVHLVCAQCLDFSPPKDPDLYVLKLFAVVYVRDNPSMKFISSSFFPGHHKIDQKFKFDVNVPSPGSSPKSTLMIEIYVGDLENAEGKLVGWCGTYFSVESTTRSTSLVIKSDFGEFLGNLLVDIICVPPGPCTELPLSDPSEAAISECRFSFLDIIIKFAHLDPSVGSTTEAYALITFEDWLRLPTRSVRCSRNKATWNQAFHVLLSSHFLDSDCPSFTVEVFLKGNSNNQKYGSVECSLRSLFGSPLPTHELQSCLLTVGNGAVYISVGLRPEDKALGLPAMGGPLWSQVPNYLSSLFRGKLLGY